MSTSEKRTEQRVVIQLCAMSGMTPTDTWKFLNQKEGVHNCSRTLVFDWHKSFREGQTEITDSARSGRPGNDQRSIRDVIDVIAKHRRKSIDDIADTFGLWLCHGTVHIIVTKDLNMNKVCARWVPRLLTDENKATRVDASREFLRRYDRDGERFLRPIITTDETWTNFYDPESKQESMVVRRDLTNAIRKKRAGCDIENLIFHQDNRLCGGI
ncbi:protein GVQW3-like [Ruditapes philippinarum]|uniref:protein GVQW3-like n=1 Tax=Ruditapes philippinarum TaxID=129788 RepID=UPI00295BD5E8|nr:protein GVQW3-like [Ruditapes philippinarum]